MCPEPDRDRDGVTSEDCGGTDCNDDDPSRYPGAPEICDTGTRDEDCNPATFGDRDGDRDGYPSASCCNLDIDGARVCGTDCDDSDPAAHPSEAESCDGLDNDCDEAIDENVLIPFYRDVDGDGFGVTDMIRTGCSAPLGYVVMGGDCDDALRAVNPGQDDTCNGRDDDCDGQLDNPMCPCSEGETRICGEPDGIGGFLERGACRPGTQVCLGMSGWDGCVNDIRPSAESCNGADDDCDGMTDENVTSVYYRDMDGDMFGVASMTMRGCAAPSGYVIQAGDCDDGAPLIKPTGTEVCNGRDDNCNTTVDEGVLLTFYRDQDGDGYGATASAMSACTAPPGYVAMPGDCRDTNPSVRPGLPMDRRNATCSTTTVTARPILDASAPTA